MICVRPFAVARMSADEAAIDGAPSQRRPRKVRDRSRTAQAVWEYGRRLSDSPQADIDDDSNACAREQKLRRAGGRRHTRTQSIDHDQVAILVNKR